MYLYFILYLCCNSVRVLVLVLYLYVYLYVQSIYTLNYTYLYVTCNYTCVHVVKFILALIRILFTGYVY